MEGDQSVKKQQAQYPRGIRHVTDYAVNRRLSQIGMPRGLLAEAAFQGHIDRNKASRLDFPGRSEYDAASTALRVICENGAPTDGRWHRDTYLGIPVAFNQDETIAIAVTGGDEWTGLDGEEDPTNTALKGPATERVTKLRLSYGDSADADINGVLFSYFLTHPVAEDIVRVEWSVPIVEADGYVRGWRERTIIGELHPDTPGRGTRKTAPLSPTGDIDITPVRRAG